VNRAGVLETTIRGILHYKLDNGVCIHRKYLEGMTGDPGKAAMSWVLAATRDDVGKVTAALDKTQLAGMGGLLVPDARSIFVAVAASGLLAVAAGVVPALGISRKSIVELIREPR
jgi:ABC-type antimicrobial peptide transport system permease subunit